MTAVTTTRMSPQGHVVIPESLRSRLGLRAGVQFVVLGEEDVVVLKAIRQPDMKDFDALIREARRQAKAAGMKPADVADAVARVRGRER